MMVSPEAVIKKIKQIKSAVMDARKNREAVIQIIDDVMLFFYDTRNARFHRMIMAFIHYCYEQDSIENFSDYIDLVKFSVGHCVKTMTEVKGEKVIFCKMKSISFGDCGQKDFTEFAEKVKAYAEKKYQINFDDWYAYEGQAIEYKNLND